MDLDLIGTFKSLYPLLFQGVATTLEITVLSLILAMIVGFIACMMNISKFMGLKVIAKFYIWLIRGTPMLVQAMYIYFAVPQLIKAITQSDFRITVFTAGLIVLTLNAGAYISEIFRGAIQAVDVGQMEAARSLGLSYGKAMMKIVAPQAVRICLPSLVNQFIITLKDSTILYAIGLPEILYQGKVFVGRTYDAFATYTWIAIFFLVIISFLSLISKYIERRMEKG